MTTFITGGTGKTGLAIANLLHASNYPVLIASRSGVAPEPFKAVKFNWFDEKTFAAPFEVDENIEKIYLVGPSVLEPFPIVKSFIDLAISKGVKRFVLCGSSVIEKGGVATGKIHQYFADIGIGYAVMRNAWFIENFGIMPEYLQSIRERDEIFSAAGDGKVPFVAVDDIAKASYDALVAEKSPNTDFCVVGPQLYSHDEVAALLSEVLGRKIIHKRLSEEEFSKFFQNSGAQEDYANGVLAWAQNKIATGEEAACFSSSKAVIGKKTLRDYVEANRKLWVKA
ncbi:hypothetical protein BDZ97DRAFT_1792059 [Flammula alnicola]|nr:hypothetical protein BDZ97DRAFT_1792059 [Flammula alnicola]